MLIEGVSFSKSIKYSWSTPGGGFTSKRGIFGSVGKLETMMCVSYGRMEDLVFSGAATGDIFIWKDIFRAIDYRWTDLVCSLY